MKNVLVSYLSSDCLGSRVDFNYTIFYHAHVSWIIEDSEKGALASEQASWVSSLVDEIPCSCFINIKRRKKNIEKSKEPVFAE